MWSTMPSLMSNLVIVVDIISRCISPIYKSAFVNIIINEWMGPFFYLIVLWLPSVLKFFICWIPNLNQTRSINASSNILIILTHNSRKHTWGSRYLWVFSFLANCSIKLNQQITEAPTIFFAILEVHTWITKTASSELCLSHQYLIQKRFQSTEIASKQRFFMHS